MDATVTSGRFRKKPVEIEARRFVSYALICQDDLAKWCGGTLRGVQKGPLNREIEIPTLEGDMRASWGDWIIRGVNGEFYPCKPDIFEKTYEVIPWTP